MTCPDDRETKVPVTVYVDEIKVIKPRGHTTDIVLDDNIIKYPENIISNNNFKLLFNKNNFDNNYDITLIDNNNNIIDSRNNTLQFIKNQIYTIEQNDITNYNLDNNTNNIYYVKLL